MGKKQNRTLGAFEKTFWLLDQIDSKDFALAAEIDGTASVSKWELAIKAAQSRHPNLSVRIVMDQMSRPAIEHVENLAIPFRVVSAHPAYGWEQEVEKELSQRFDTTRGPLVRIVLVQKPKDCVLIVVANHILADGTSVSYLIRDLLAAVMGSKLKSYQVQLSNDQTLGLPEDLPVQSVEEMPIMKASRKIVRPLVSSLRFSSDKTNRIIERARAERTTVHGAICAAAVMAGRKMRVEWSDIKMELISPICSRGVLGLDDNFGLNITTHPIFFENEQELTFWELARMAKNGLEGTISEEHVR
ncbi:MAG: condensation protein, partial [Sphingobacteriales bacterium]